jgi:hypothetical protein
MVGGHESQSLSSRHQHIMFAPLRAAAERASTKIEDGNGGSARQPTQQDIAAHDVRIVQRPDTAFGRAISLRWHA